MKHTLFGLVGPSLYALGVFGYMVIGDCIRERQILFDFWDLFFLAGMAMIVPFGLLPLAVAICAASGALVGLTASIIASRSKRSSVLTAIIYGIMAIIPMVKLLSKPLSPYPSTNIAIFYLPSALFVTTMALIGTLVHQHVAVLASRRLTCAGGDSAFGAE